MGPKSTVSPKWDPQGGGVPRVLEIALGGIWATPFHFIFGRSGRGVASRPLPRQTRREALPAQMVTRDPKGGEVPRFTWAWTWVPFGRPKPFISIALQSLFLSHPSLQTSPRYFHELGLKLFYRRAAILQVRCLASSSQCKMLLQAPRRWS